MTTIGLGLLDTELYGARVAYDSIGINDDDVVVMSGLVERPWDDAGKSRFPSVGRFYFSLSISESRRLLVQDEAGVGELFIDKVVFDALAGHLVFESSIPGRVELWTNSEAADFVIASFPQEVKRAIRWRPYIKQP